MELVVVIFQMILEAFGEAKPRIFSGALMLIGLLLFVSGYIFLGVMAWVFAVLILLFVKPA